MTLSIGLPVKVNAVIKDVNENQIANGTCIWSTKYPFVTSLRMLDRPMIGIWTTWFQPNRCEQSSNLNLVRFNNTNHFTKVLQSVFDKRGGKIGFIESISNPFCGDCSRARLSANGSIYLLVF